MVPTQVYFEHELQVAKLPNLQRRKTAKVLMLHGHGQSGKFFYHKTKKIIECLQIKAAAEYRKCFPGGFELFYPNGPLQAGDDPDADVWVWGIGDFQNDLIKGIDETIIKILGILNTHGPFIGIIGFSTGAAIAAIIASLLERSRPARLQSYQRTEIVHPRLKFVICFSGFKLAHPGHQELYSSLIQTPVMHIIATLDTMISKEQTKELISQCENNIEVYFDGTHYVPQGQCQTNAICDFILQSLAGHQSYEKKNNQD